MKKGNIKLVFISSLVLIGIIGGVVSTTFAENNIYALLSQWYNQKVIEVEVEIQQEIESELVVQKERLKSDIKEKMEVGLQWINYLPISGILNLVM